MMLQKRTLVLVFVLVFLGLAIVICSFVLNRAEREKRVEAGSANAAITTQVDWDAGTKSNIDSTGGSATISDKSLVHEISDFGSYTFDGSEGSSQSNVVDGNLATYWGSDSILGGEDMVLQMNFEEEKTVAVEVKTQAGEALLQNLFTSTNGTDWTQISSCPGGSQDESSPPNYVINFCSSTFNYLSFRFINIPGPFDYMGRLKELSLYTEAASATHTTHSIDGGESFWSWDSNTITQSVPANTSATYQYRTSANGTDWTAWVGSIGSVTSRAGDDSNNPTRYRYLQIKATLSNTDGASTPTIDSYDIDYHTEVKPTAPSAQTATTQ